ncbi:hypothetical protein [Ancylobacter sp. IITR112]|uniref:hypothetical protein n=1 Tax=Ancylobacter sp. IITR112 TaxID=3138073 RepID=UPI00352A3EAC
MTSKYKPTAILHVDEKFYSLVLSINALCSLETITGRPAGSMVMELIDAAAKPQTISVKMLRTMLWAALREYHPEIDEDGAGQIATDAGAFNVLAAVMEAAAAAFPAPNIVNKSAAEVVAEVSEAIPAA